jgi:hypothetical protein
MAQEMVVLEAKLIDSADQAYAMADSDPYLRKNALIFIYTALMMDNLIEANHLGVLTYSEWTKLKAYSTKADPKEEYDIRKEKILKYVDRAQVLLPNDLRMPSWVYGMKAKHVDPIYADEIINMARDRQDTFALISALTVTKNIKLNDDQEAVLAKLVKKFTSLSSPCFFGKTKSQCRSTELAPYASQTGVIMMADYRLKTAKKEKSNRLQKLGRIFSRALYNSTGMVWMKDSTPFWVNKHIIPGRVALTDKYAKIEDINAFWKTPDSQVIYSCSSCHASAVKPQEQVQEQTQPAMVDKSLFVH